MKPFSSLYNATSYATSAYAQRYAQLGKSNIIFYHKNYKYGITNFFVIIF